MTPTYVYEHLDLELKATFRGSIVLEMLVIEFSEMMA